MRKMPVVLLAHQSHGAYSQPHLAFITCPLFRHTPRPVPLPQRRALGGLALLRGADASRG